MASTKKISTKERIVAVATELFESQGFAATGINQIIDEAKTAKASFYDHFESKELLGKEYLARYGEAHLVLIGALMRRSATPQDFIRSWVRILKRQLRERRFYGCPMANMRAQIGSTSPVLSSAVRLLADKTIALISDYLLEHNPGGGFSHAKAALLGARRIFAAYEGSIHIWQLTGDEAALDDIEFLATAVLKI